MGKNLFFLLGDADSKWDNQPEVVEHRNTTAREQLLIFFSFPQSSFGLYTVATKLQITYYTYIICR